MSPFSLHGFFQRFLPLSDADWKLAEPFFHLVSLEKGEHWVRPGQVVQQMAVVEKGLLRLYYQQENREKIMLFFREGSIAGDYFSLLSQTPSLRPVQALEPCRLWAIRGADLQRLYQHPAWEQLGRKLAEMAYLYAVHRANRLLHDKPETRYQTLLQEQPDLLQRVPQYMVASYLDLTPEALSRVKARLQQQGSAAPSVHGPLDEEIPW